MSSSSDDDKVVLFPGRHASSPLIRGLPGIEPDAVYVFKLGPLETQEGRRFAYIALQGDGTSHPSALAANDARGLAHLASLFQGRRLYCEPRLVRAGAAHGFVSRSVPPELLPARALFALSTEWSQLSPETPPQFLLQLLEAASVLWRAHPWELWTTIEVLELRLEGIDPVWREVCVLGNGSEEFGFALYSQPGSVERLGGLTEEERIQESLRMESLALLFEKEPVWVRTEVRRVTGLPVFPVLMHLSPSGFAPLSLEDLSTLLAVTRALTRLSPEQLELREEVSLGGIHVTAHVRAHVPLFTASRPLPPTPPRSPRSAGPGTPPPPALPPSPRRKISQTLISFVQPLVPEPGEMNPDGFMMVLELAVTTWNAVVLDTWEPGQDRVGAVRAAVQSLPEEMREGMLPLFEVLVERKRSDFQEDLRLMGGLQVRWAVDGEPRVRLQWRLPGT